MRTFTLRNLITLLVILGFAAYVSLRYIPINGEYLGDQARQDRKNVVELLEQSKPEEALSIIHHYSGEIKARTKNGLQWLELLILTAEQRGDAKQLRLLFEFYPEIFKDYEGASILVATSYIVDGQSDGYDVVRGLWTGQMTNAFPWLALDADRLLLENQTSQAMALLQSRTFNDSEEVGRLVRLAALNNEEDPQIAWKYLLEAYVIDPHNADIRFYRAKFLEFSGKSSRAEAEYQAAADLQPEDSYMQDELAGFYLRHGRYPEALEIWLAHLNLPASDDRWINALFWGKVTTPLEIDWAGIPLPEGQFAPLIQYLIALNPVQFWDPVMFAKVPRQEFFLLTQQATFWLRLVDALKSNRENDALEMLRNNTFIPVSWFPELELTLRRVLAFRASRHFEEDSSLKMSYPVAADSLRLSPAFEQIEKLVTGGGDGQLNKLLLSNEVFSAIFMAAGWYEAGLSLHALETIPQDFPGWVVTNYQEALRRNRAPG